MAGILGVGGRDRSLRLRFVAVGVCLGLIAALGHLPGGAIGAGYTDDALRCDVLGNRIIYGRVLIGEMENYGSVRSVDQSPNAILLLTRTGLAR